ncbi:efflux RND transporter periplasmic adaptor subunit [Chitinibacteraceae bacterium HSL-7]
MTDLRRAMVLAALALTACGGKAQKDHEKPHPTVSVATAKTQDLPLSVTERGVVVPVNEVDVRPQLASVVTRLHVREGQDVRAGQLLVTLDNRSEASDLSRSDANNRKLEADLLLARQNLKRDRELASSGFISPSAVDNSIAQVKALEAELAASRAEQAGNAVKDSQTRIAAPISGRIGELAIRIGSLVQPSGDALMRIVQLDPIQVAFNVSADQLPALRAAKESLAVRINGQAQTGHLVFIDNMIDRTTGTLKVKAEFANSDRALWPGQDVSVTLEAGIERAAIVIPSECVLDGPDRKLVYLLKPDQTVQDQTVTVSRVTAGLAVTQGVSAGDKVVCEGGRQLRSGDKVNVSAS